MIQPVRPPVSTSIIYPESDGKPMADNTKQGRWIFVLFGNLAAWYRSDGSVFIAADLFWYPVEGHPETCQAADVLVIFGRPKGDRGSYRQWEEGNVPVTVVFEVLSPSNSYMEMADKLVFYEEYGVEEYYVYDPDTNRLAVYLRRGDVLVRVRQVRGFVSPRLGIRFDFTGSEMVVYRPDGQRFLTFEELMEERDRERQRAVEAEERADHAEQRADHAEQRAGLAEQRAGLAEQRAGLAEQRLARFRELSRKARQQQASVDELAELEHFEAKDSPPGS